MRRALLALGLALGMGPLAVSTALACPPDGDGKKKDEAARTECPPDGDGKKKDEV